MLLRSSEVGCLQFPVRVCGINRMYKLCVLITNSKSGDCSSKLHVLPYKSLLNALEPYRGFLPEVQVGLVLISKISGSAALFS